MSMHAQNLHVPAPIRIVDSYDDGRDARHFTFEYLSPADVPHHALPGQFFLLQVPGAGASAFTYSALPGRDGRFGALVRKVGSVTGALFSRRPGDVLGARGPFGQAWPLEKLAGRRVLVVGGGCGLAPLVAVVNRLAAERVPLALLYSARDEQARVLGRERAAWRAAGLPLLEVLDAPHSIGPVPHLDAACAPLGGLPDVVLTCGPEAMMFALAHTLQQRGMRGGDIYLSLERRMHCGTGHCGHCYIDGRYCCTDGPVLAWQAVAERPHGAQGKSARP